MVRSEINVWQGFLLAIATYTLVNFTWVFFRAKEFGTAKNMIFSMLYLNGDGEKILGYFDIIKVMVISLILFLTHWYMRRNTVKSVSTNLNPYVFGVVWAILVFLILIAQGSGEQFIYFQF
jgi:alginate O-acetyltransferase complex protein AlgI